jgi:hypothetical protein
VHGIIQEAGSDVIRLLLSRLYVSLLSRLAEPVEASYQQAVDNDVDGAIAMHNFAL